ncbi:MAG: NAD(P)-dependent alcohol dehydrogenase [Ardenticatenaceae bacterium]|nr:NAD(P)-dependent alcohol dehydrogenase [Ardenticatenaceae bacterium]
MKAIVTTKYGSPEVLRLEEVEKPTPKDNEVLIKIHAAAITAGDVIVLKGEPFVTRFATGLLEPKNTIPGKEMAGRVEAVGQNVTQFQPGDEVFGDLSVASWGAFAEYVAVPESAIALKPTNLTFEEAAAVPESAIVALQGLRDKGKVQPGHKVLINGASGGVGLYAVQIAKAFGAEVTAVCSTRNIELVRLLGADYVIDYTQEDFTQNGQQYDLILAANGYHPISDYKRALSPEGIYVATGGTMTQSLQATMIGPFISIMGRKKMGGMLVKPNKNDLVFIKELIEAGKVKPVIDRRYSLSEAADAFHYMGEGRAQGKVVITVEQNSK